MSDPTLLLVGGTDETLVTAADLGIRVLLLQHPSKITDVQRDAAHQVQVLDFVDWQHVAPAAANWWRQVGFDAVLSLTEPGLENAGRLNDLYRTGGTGYQVAHRFRDKQAMRAHLADDPRLAVRSRTVTTRADLWACPDALGYPFIVKPSDGTASLGVRIVHSPDDLEDAWQHIRRLRGSRTDRVSTLFVLGDFVAEEYLPGPEYSVEAFSFAGRHVVVSVTEKLCSPGSFTELGHLVPGRIAAAQRAEVTATVQDFLTAMGLRDGVSHTEVKVGPSGVRVVEGHNRPAGDAIPSLVRAAYDVDLIRLSLAWPFGLAPALAESPRPRGGACTRFLVGEPGRVARICGSGDLGAEPGVITWQLTTEEGATVRPLADNWDRLGLLAVRAGTASAAYRQAADVLSRNLRVEIVTSEGRLSHARLAEPAIGTDLLGRALDGSWPLGDSGPDSSPAQRLAAREVVSLTPHPESTRSILEQVS
ncbi:MAG: ATP-grasp domain-containing protein [Actinomycetales bacterium]